MRRRVAGYPRSHESITNPPPQPLPHLSDLPVLDRLAADSRLERVPARGGYFNTNVPDISRYGDGSRECSRSPRPQPPGKLLVGPHCVAAEPGSVHEFPSHPPTASLLHKYSRPGSRPLHEVAQLPRPLDAGHRHAASLVLLAAQTRAAETERRDRVGAELRSDLRGLRGGAGFGWSSETVLGNRAAADPCFAAALVSVRSADA